MRGANEIDFRLVTPFSNCNDMSAPAGSSNHFVFRNIVARPPRLLSARLWGVMERFWTSLYCRYCSSWFDVLNVCRVRPFGRIKSKQIAVLKPNGKLNHGSKRGPICQSRSTDAAAEPARNCQTWKQSGCIAVNGLPKNQGVSTRVSSLPDLEHHAAAITAVDVKNANTCDKSTQNPFGNTETWQIFKTCSASCICNGVGLVLLLINMTKWEIGSRAKGL